MNEIIPTTGQSLKPYSEKDRPACPFYGFNAMMGILIDQNGNQCALITDSYSPCRMEMNSETPEWENCPANNPKITSGLEAAMDKMRVFPDEFRPSNPNGWEGITLREWINYLANKEK